MKKIFSLIKASMTSDMNLFKIKTKNAKYKKVLPVFIFILIFAVILSYAEMFMEPLRKVHLEFVLLSLFIFITFIMTLVEGIYKTGNLLFNCKDDNMLFSLPIKKSTVLFVRIFKFYIFELLYNSLLLLPAFVSYAIHVKVGISYYIVSIISLLLLPIIPVAISCIIGFIISLTSSRFKYKNIVQIFITMLFLLGMLCVSYNLDTIVMNISKNATSINEIITKIYYPAGTCINLVTNFNIMELLIFILINILVFILTVLLLSKIYFKTNSRIKSVTTTSKNKNYQIKYSKPIKSLIKKELQRFTNSPVFVINAGFGLVLFLVGCIGISIKFDDVIKMFVKNKSISISTIKSYIPIITFGLITIASLMSSITSSMISLEGKSFNILKSLPIKANTIIISKVLTAVLIMIVPIIVGDVILFLNFKFSILEIIVLLISSIVLPLVSEIIGIIINLKYPKMNAANDTEVVKQSMSSTIAVFIGMAMVGLTGFDLYFFIKQGISINTILIMNLGIYIVILILLMIYLNKKSIKDFNNINV